MPTYHPAYVLRAGGEAMAEMRADLVRAKRLIAAGRRVSWPVERPHASADATRALAGRLAPLSRAGDVVLLVGDLGAGKTVFAQGFAAALGVDGPVTSPTFALVRHYRCGRAAPCRTLIHADVYRTESLAEVADLALAELVEEDAVALVEWGDLRRARARETARSWSPSSRPTPSAPPDRRAVTIVGRGRWRDRAAEVAAALAPVVRDAGRRESWWPCRERVPVAPAAKTPRDRGHRDGDRDGRGGRPDAGGRRGRVHAHRVAGATSRR